MTTEDRRKASTTMSLASAGPTNTVANCTSATECSRQRSSICDGDHGLGRTQRRGGDTRKLTTQSDVSVDLIARDAKHMLGEHVDGLSGGDKRCRYRLKRRGHKDAIPSYSTQLQRGGTDGRECVGTYIRLAAANPKRFECPGAYAG